jgi:hypothetical protein
MTFVLCGHVLYDLYPKSHMYSMTCISEEGGDLAAEAGDNIPPKVPLEHNQGKHELNQTHSKTISFQEKIKKKCQQILSCETIKECCWVDWFLNEQAPDNVPPVNMPENKT